MYCQGRQFRKKTCTQFAKHIALTTLAHQSLNITQGLGTSTLYTTSVIIHNEALGGAGRHRRKPPHSPHFHTADMQESCIEKIGRGDDHRQWHTWQQVRLNLWTSRHPKP